MNMNGTYNNDEVNDLLFFFCCFVELLYRCVSGGIQCADNGKTMTTLNLLKL